MNNAPCVKPVNSVMNAFKDEKLYATEGLKNLKLSSRRVIFSARVALFILRQSSCSQSPAFLKGMFYRQRSFIVASAYRRNYLVDGLEP